MLGAVAAEKSQVVHTGDELEALADPPGSVLRAGGDDAGDDVVFPAGGQHPVDGGHNLGVVHRMAGGGVGLEGDAHLQGQVAGADKNGV